MDLCPGPNKNLVYAVRLRVVARYFGQFTLLIAFLRLIPIPVAVSTGEKWTALRYLGVVGLFAVIGLLFTRISEPRRLQVNEAMLLAALLGRSLGFDHVIVQIHDTDYLPTCRELGLDNTMIPAKTIGRYLADMVAGVDILEISPFVNGEARFMLFAIEGQH
jgi:hypothetical protein